MLDVTEHAKKIVEGVRDIRKNLTLLFLTDIFKGCDLKKIRESGLDNLFNYIIWYKIIFYSNKFFL